jgi:hypothetical protein
VERYIGNGFGHFEIVISIADTKKITVTEPIIQLFKYVYFMEPRRVPDA